jgi:hypothetical protein
VPSWRLSPQLLYSGKARLLIVSGLSIRLRTTSSRPLGGIVGIFFLALAATLSTAGIGWFRRLLWGWRLAVIIISTQVLGDAVNCVRGDLLRGGTGVIIAGALLLFLVQPRIRAAFA